MNNPEIFVFDFDGVIIDTPKKYAEIFTLVCLKMGKKITTEEAQYYSKSKHNFEKYFQSESERKIAYRLYQEIEKELFPVSEIPLVKGSKEKLEEIKTTGREIAIFTDRTRKSLDEALEVHNLQQYIDVSRTLCCTGEKKPSPKGLFEIINHFSVQAQNCLFIGDSDVDKNAAINAKVSFIGVLSGVNNQKDWGDTQYISDISHLKVNR